MTIAMCSVVPEGIVLGADSTSSMFHDGTGFHYFNHNQKIFEIGENSTVGLLTWGLGGLKDVSYRTLIAQLADDLANHPAVDMADISTRWANLIWGTYSQLFAIEIGRIAALAAMAPFDPLAAPPVPGARNLDEEKELGNLRHVLYVGFCIAGYTLPDRTPKAYQISVHPEGSQPPVPALLTAPLSFWGAPNFILRLLNGWDHELKAAIIASGKWQGSEAELVQELNKSALRVGSSTLRDAIDFVYSSIHSTIKALKFSHLSQICGGPIELAVISTDRHFRWVRHKKWDSAITEGDIV